MHARVRTYAGSVGSIAAIAHETFDLQIEQLKYASSMGRIRLHVAVIKDKKAQLR